MRMLRYTCALACLLACCLAGQAADIFMRVAGIPGESQDARHRDEIVLNGYTVGFAQAGAMATGAGGGAGRATIAPFTVTKFVDVSTPRLAQASLSGQRLPEVRITVRQPGAEPRDFLQFTLTDVMVSGFTQEVQREDNAPVETLQLSFAAIEMVYTPQRPDGSPGAPVQMRWDVRRNAAG